MSEAVILDGAHQESIQLAIVARWRLSYEALAAMFRAEAHFKVAYTTTRVETVAIVSQHRHLNAMLMEAHFIRSRVGPQPTFASTQLGNFPIVVLDDELHFGRLASVLAERRGGYFTKNSTSSELSAGIRRMVGGERAFGADVEPHIQETADGWQLRTTASGSSLSQLTPREIEVLRLIALGHSITECAEILQLSPNTIDNHKSRTMKKLGVHKSLELARIAIREGLIEN